MIDRGINFIDVQRIVTLHMCFNQNIYKITVSHVIHSFER